MLAGLRCVGLAVLACLAAGEVAANGIKSGGDTVAMVINQQAAPPIAGDLEPNELIRATAELVLGDIRANKEAYGEDSSDLYLKVRDWVFPHFDFQRISRYVLGSAWKQASADMQQQFTQEFSTLMLHTYGSALLAFQDQHVEYLPFSAKENSAMATVKTKVHSDDGSVAPVDYRLSNATGQWKVLDVKIDGISLVKTYRSEYGSIVKREGLGKLIDALTERNQRNL